MTAFVKIILSVAVFAVALVALFVVFDVVTLREAMGDFRRVLLAAAILIVSGGAVALLAKGKEVS